jgi:SAM-dependent methyltransferase
MSSAEAAGNDAGNSRVAKLLRRIDPATQRGLEIGALDKPVVTPAMGDVRYVDYAPSEDLRRNHAGSPTVDAGRIVQIDYVWGASTLREAVGPHESFDYVIGSHVLEHVPDLVTWFAEVAEVLKPSGVVSLIVPDKRFIFDRLRRTSDLSEVIDAHLARRRKPSVRQIFDFYRWHARVDASLAWAGAIDDLALECVHDEAFALGVCRDAIRRDAYVDAHCWVFTPASFVSLLRDLAGLDLLAFRVVEFFSTAPGEIDFFVTLERLPDGLTPAERLRLQRESLPIVDL